MIIESNKGCCVKEQIDPAKRTYNIILLIVAGLGGLLYGVDVGIIAGALPYLEATSGLTSGQLSIIVAAVLLGSVISTLFAGLLADLMGRKKLMIISGVMFIISIPIIALAHGYGPLVFGRLLQGISAGFIGVVVPLYLAECLSAANRGKGTGLFQWLLTFGICAAALIAIFFSIWLGNIEATGNVDKIFAAKDLAWRSIFWVSLPPGILFVIGAFFVAESPRWLHKKGNIEAVRTALLRSRSEEQAEAEIKVMNEVEDSEKQKTSTGEKIKESLLKKKYVIPFLLACVILACNQLTGINSIIGYNATILIQAGLSDVAAHWGYVIFTLVNFLMTIVAIMLVDRKGRKFLLSLGSAGIIVSLVCVGFLFKSTEKMRVDCGTVIQKMVTPEQKLGISYNAQIANNMLSQEGEPGKAILDKPTTMNVIYSYGDYRASTNVVRSTDLGAKISIDRDSCVPPNKVVAFFSNPFGNLDEARTAPLKIEHANITPIPSAEKGWLVAIFLYIFTAFFAVGPGVCVWLALSELMPTRIRSNGMSIALLINQAVSTAIAAVFLPTVGQYGYGTMFFTFAICTIVYFITATFFLPETKGKTLEQVEEYFSGDKNALKD
ncbi:MAG TPA: MFS transporter [Lentisphaeria bacterium]|nr:MFS transporter [Lentisphaeria bacterium]